MSVLQTYLNWANSVLADTGIHISGLAALQDGKVLCDIIDVLDPGAGLVEKVKGSGDVSSLTYVNTAIDHMKSNGVQIKFRAEDILKGDVKSILDVLWSLILNYGIHRIGQPAQQRSIGRGKKILLEWCQRQLGTTFDPSDTLTFSLCRNGWCVPLLEKVTQHNAYTSQDKAEHLDNLMKVVQDRFLIQAGIIQPRDVLDGTVDEHSLMIFLSLLKRRVDKQSLADQKSLATDERHRAIEDDSKLQVDTTTEQMNNVRRDHWTQKQQQQRSIGNLTTLRNWQDSNTLPDDQRSSQSSYPPFHTVPSSEPKSFCKSSSHLSSQWRAQYKTNYPQSDSPSLQRELDMNENRKLPRNVVSENKSFVSLDFKNSRNVGQEKATQTSPKPIPVLNQQGLRSSNQYLEGWGRVEIPRPRDYIEQWEDVMDRLSSGSFIDQSEELWSNSLPNISSVRRWRSFDAYKAHRAKLNTASTHQQYGGICRSKSSDSSTRLPLSRASAHGYTSRREQVDSRQNEDWIERRPLNNTPDDGFIASHAGIHKFYNSPASSSFYPGIKSNLKSQTDFLPRSSAVPTVDHRRSGLSVSSRCPSPTSRSPKFRSQSVGSRCIGHSRRLRFLSPSESMSPDNQPEFGYRRSPVSISSRNRFLFSQTNYPGVRKTLFDPHSNSEHYASNQNAVFSEMSPKGCGRIPRKEAWEQGHSRKGTVDNRATGRKLLSDVTQRISQETDALNQRSSEERQDIRIPTEGHTNKYNSHRLDSYSHASSRDSSFNQMLLSQQIELLNKVTDKSKSCPLLYRVDSPARKKLSTTFTDCVMPSENQDLHAHFHHGHDNSTDVSDSDSLLFNNQNCSESNFEPESLKYSVRLNKAQISNLISKAKLTDLEVGRLKEAVATSEVENEILESKLRKGRQEISQKFRHVHGVLDDCRRHLARTQEENMELRTTLRQERRQSEEGGRRVAELETDFSQVATENQHLQNELFHKHQLLERVASRAGLVVDELRADRSMLADGLAELQDDNQHLREEVSTLEQLHTAAVSTIETLRTNLAQIRAEGARRLNEATHSRQLSSDLTRRTTRDFQNLDEAIRHPRRHSSPLSDNGSGFIVTDEAYYSSVEDVDRGSQQINSPWWHEETTRSFDNQRFFRDGKELLQNEADSIEDEVPPYNEAYNFKQDLRNSRKSRHENWDDNEFTEVNSENVFTRDGTFQSTSRSLSSKAEDSTRPKTQPYTFKTTEREKNLVDVTDSLHASNVYEMSKFTSKGFNQPMLSEANRLLADQLVQKYTGNFTAAGHSGILVV